MIRLFSTPSSFQGNPTGYALNQAGHAILGAIWVYFGLPFAAWVAFYIAWEAAQMWLFDASLWDAIEDASFAIGGALAVASLPVVAVLAGFWLSGIARRVEERA